MYILLHAHTKSVAILVDSENWSKYIFFKTLKNNNTPTQSVVRLVEIKNLSKLLFIFLTTTTTHTHTHTQSVSRLVDSENWSKFFFYKKQNNNMPTQKVLLD